MAYEFKIRRTVEFSDTDSAGIVHFATFFRYMEAAEHAFFRSLGLSIFMNIDGRVVTFPRVHADADFHSPLRFEDTAEIHVLIREMRTKAIVFDFFIYRMADDELQFCARGSIITACVTKEDGALRSVPIPSHIREKLQPAPPELLRPCPPRSGRTNG
jgi:acyl-CoA thioester hydrolase